MLNSHSSIKQVVSLQLQYTSKLSIILIPVQSDTYLDAVWLCRDQGGALALPRRPEDLVAIQEVVREWVGRVRPAFSGGFWLDPRFARTGMVDLEGDDSAHAGQCLVLIPEGDVRYIEQFFENSCCNLLPVFQPFLQRKNNKQCIYFDRFQPFSCVKQVSHMSFQSSLSLSWVPCAGQPSSFSPLCQASFGFEPNYHPAAASRGLTRGLGRSGVEVGDVDDLSCLDQLSRKVFIHRITSDVIGDDEVACANMHVDYMRGEN